MSRKERERLVIFTKIKNKELSRREGSEVLGMSLRQMHRSYVRFVAQGDRGLLHRSRGSVSPRRVDAGQKAQALELCRGRYRGFGPTLAAEKLGEVHGIWASHDTVRRWLREAGLLERTRRGRRSRRRRERKARLGQMVQMDGSPHAWFEDRAKPCVLMTVIDDATGRRAWSVLPGRDAGVGDGLFRAVGSNGSAFRRRCTWTGTRSTAVIVRPGPRSCLPASSR